MPSPAAAGTSIAIGPAGSAVEQLAQQAEARLHFLGADPDARVDVALGQHRHVEVELVIGRIAGVAPRVLAAAAGAADIAAGAEAMDERLPRDARADRAIEQRGLLVVDAE